MCSYIVLSDMHCTALVRFDKLTQFIVTKGSESGSNACWVGIQARIQLWLRGGCENNGTQTFAAVSRNLTRFNNIVIQARAQMSADKDAVGLSRVHMYESKCILPLRNNCLFCS